MRFQLILATSLAAVGLAAPNAAPNVGLERFEAPLVPRGCPGGGPGNACPAGFFQCFGHCAEVFKCVLVLPVVVLLGDVDARSQRAWSSVGNASLGMFAKCENIRASGPLRIHRQVLFNATRGSGAGLMIQSACKRRMPIARRLPYQDMRPVADRGGNLWRQHHAYVGLRGDVYVPGSSTCQSSIFDVSSVAARRP
ncbi:hypothetical protein AURDEDRAFT_127957 [Auricularia subglabra TFB-10046 SS5]|nr:hypothetical protein AURDEDRAFT_127957 [Auricularia subglabra TFB-10046 SS5]